MGCGSSNATKVLNETNGGVGGTDSKKNVDELSDDNKNSVKYPPAEAFEIPLKPEDELDSSTGSGSLIRKHPPKRIQKLLEDRPQTPHTLEDLETKLANAEMRRQQILLQRVNTIKMNIKERVDEDDGTDNDDDVITAKIDEKESN